MDPTELVREEVKKLVRPVHGGLGWKYEGVEDFSSNLNPYGPPADVAQFVQEALGKLVHYPDDRSTEFRQAICQRYGLVDAHVIAGAGSAELIRLFPETFLSPGDKVLMYRPTFSEYGFACQLQGATINSVPLREDNDLRFDLEEMRENLPGCKVAYLCNPNNPTGNIVPRKKVLEFARDCERNGTLLFLDETLLELVESASSISCLKEVESYDNLFIIRSLTKCFAIPGMRIGYAVGSRDIIKHMESARLSWNLGQIEQHVGARLLLDRYHHIEKAAKMMAVEKGRMAQEISRTGLVDARLPDSFFFFSRVNGTTGASLQVDLLKHKLLVRDCASFGAPFHNYARFAVKTPERNDALINAFRSLAEGRA